MIKKLTIVLLFGVACVGCASNKKPVANYQPPAVDYKPPVVHNEPPVVNNRATVIEDKPRNTSYSSGSGSGIMIRGASSAAHQVYQ